MRAKKFVNKARNDVRTGKSGSQGEGLCERDSWASRPPPVAFAYLSKAPKTTRIISFSNQLCLPLAVPGGL